MINQISMPPASKLLVTDRLLYVCARADLVRNESRTRMRMPQAVPALKGLSEVSLQAVLISNYSYVDGCARQRTLYTMK